MSYSGLPSTFRGDSTTLDAHPMWNLPSPGLISIVQNVGPLLVIYIYKIYVYSQKGPTNRLWFYVSGTHLARSKFDQSVKFESSWPKATYLFVKMAPTHVLLCVWSVCCFAVSSLRTPGFSGVAGHRSDLFQTWDRYGGPPNGVWWFIKLSLLKCYGWYNMYNYN